MNNKRKPVPAQAMASTSENKEWVNERLAHDRQRRRFKSILFWSVCVLCFFLYVTFFFSLVLLLTHTVAMQSFFAHKHILGLILPLLLVPSLMTWGLIRAVYRVEHSTLDYGDVLKFGMNMHPLG